MTSPMVYLDHNATTKPSPEVVSAVVRGLEACWCNPSSVHRGGQEAKYAIEIARGQMAGLLGIRSREVTFTGSGTESIDLAIRGTLGALHRSNPEMSKPEKNIIVTTPIEHSAIRNLCHQLESTGRARVVMLPVLRSGVVDISGLDSMLEAHRGQVALVSVQWVNNETGVIQPVHRVGEACERYNVVYHCDATQWVGKMETDLSADGAPKIDLLSCSPHKFHGPKGVGVLWVRRGIKLLPTTPGSQELGRRGGTEAVPAIMGAGVAAEQAGAWVGDVENRAKIEQLRDRLEGGILEACAGSVVNTTTDPDLRVWGTTSIGFPRLEAEAILLSLAERKVCVSAGSACASGSLDPSPVLLAMGVDEQVAHGSIRLSLGRETTGEEIEHALGVISAVTAQLWRSMPG